jgi:hypothetical protein
MEEERIELNVKERERLKVLHEVERGHLPQIAAAPREPTLPQHPSERLQIFRVPASLWFLKGCEFGRFARAQHRELQASNHPGRAAHPPAV